MTKKIIINYSRCLFTMLCLVFGTGIQKSQAGTSALEMGLCDLVNEMPNAECESHSYNDVYKYGPYDPYNKGMGKIRSQAAYCLIRDGDGAHADSTIGDDWYEFGARSRFHLTHAGLDGAGIYEASGQRILDLVLFGAELTGVEVQNLDASFPKERESLPHFRCSQKIKWRGMTICTRMSPYYRHGYYMQLETSAYAWEFDLGAMIDYPGLEIIFGQDVPFSNAGTTKLPGANLTDGVIPDEAGNANSWEWGYHPNITDDPTTYLDAAFPVVNASAFRFSLSLGIDLQGYYNLKESPDPDNPGYNIANDPDGGAIADDPSPFGGATSTYIASNAGIDVGANVCIDLGWLGTWCADFTIIDEDIPDAPNEELNMISYDGSGTPMAVRWQEGSMITTPSQMKNEINECLSAPTIDQPPEEGPLPDEWEEFFEEVAQTFAEHYRPCNVNQPGPSEECFVDCVSFDLCDDNGNVHESEGDAYPEN